VERNVKVVILAGGFGTRLAELTGSVPKPMVPIGGKPILWHIMNHYAKYGYEEFVLALGYKAEVIKSFFLNYPSLDSDFTISLKSGEIEWHNRSDQSWKVTLVDTGLNSMTGGRLGRLRSLLADETFMLTYGDGLSNVDIGALVDCHKKNNKMVTVTTVHPGARFGELDIQDNKVKSFREKPQTSQGWINGGFFVIEPGFLDQISSDDTVLEQEPLEQVASAGQLNAFKHEGFWQCMDSVRDRNYLEGLWSRGDAPWT
jgi:glucose-1-phosphate cytidylyltransferase